MAYYNWKYRGILENCSANYDKGVYLLIFNGNPKRIIYVGTTNCFARKLKQHKEGYLKGNRTIWRVTSKEDIVIKDLSDKIEIIMKEIKTDNKS